MKRLVGLFVLAMLLVSPLGSLAARAEEAGTNIIVKEDFEQGKISSLGSATAGNGTISLVDKNNPPEGGNEINPLAGNYCVKLTGSPWSNAKLFLDWGNKNGKMEWNTTYRLSFWIVKTSGGAANSIGGPYLTLSCGGTGFSWTGVPEGAAWLDAGWTYYEVFFTTGAPAENTEDNPTINLVLATYPGQSTYYDDIKLEKVDRAFLSFVEPTGIATSSITGTNYLSKTTIQKNYTIDGKTAWLYPFCQKVKPVSALGGNVRVMAQYVPETVTEKSSLMVGIYESDEDGDRLVDVQIKEANYAGTPVYKEGSETEVDYYTMGDGVEYMDVDTSAYKTGNYYMKAFMWSSVSGLKPLGESAVLGA